MFILNRNGLKLCNMILYSGKCTSRPKYNVLKYNLMVLDEMVEGETLLIRLITGILGYVSQNE